MRRWLLLDLEHTAFNELPVLPFLAPRVFEQSYHQRRAASLHGRVKHGLQKRGFTNVSTRFDGQRIDREQRDLSCGPCRHASTGRNNSLRSSSRCRGSSCDVQGSYSARAYSHGSVTSYYRYDTKHTEDSINVASATSESVPKLHPPRFADLGAETFDMQDGPHASPSSFNQYPEQPNNANSASTRPERSVSGHVVPANGFQHKYEAEDGSRNKVSKDSGVDDSSTLALTNASERRRPFMAEVEQRWPLKPSNKSLSQGPAIPGDQAESTASSSLGSFLRDWTESVAYLNAQHDPHFPLEDREQRLSQLFSRFMSHQHMSPAVEEFLERFPRITRRNEITAQTVWNELTEQDQLSNWSVILRYYLWKAPMSALKFLLLTGLKLPLYQISDVLDMIAMNTRTHSNSGRYARFLGAVRTILESNPVNFPLTQRTLYVLLVRRHLLSVTAKDLHDLFSQHQVKLEFNSQLQFAHALACERQHELASAVFFQATQNGAQLNSKQVLDTAAKLLVELSPKGGYSASTKLIADFLSAGITITLPMYNILLLRAIQSQDADTTWKIYELIKHCGMQPDDYTYSIALKGCRTLGNAQQFEEVLMDIRSPKDHEPNDFLLAEMMWDLYFFRSRTSNMKARFNRLLHHYAGYFDLKPLYSFGMIRPEMVKDLDASHTRFPTPRIAAILIFAFLRTASINESIYVYQNFRNLVENDRDPLSVSLAASHFIYNAFLHRICTSDPPLWQQILADMSTTLPGTIDSETGQVFIPPKPNIQSMNIVLHSFAKKRDVASVKKVHDMMGEMKVVPDVVTYTSIMDAYARKQDVEGVAAVLKYMESQAIAANQITLKSVHRIQDRANLVQELQKIQESAAEQTIPLEAA